MDPLILRCNNVEVSHDVNGVEVSAYLVSDGDIKKFIDGLHVEDITDLLLNPARMKAIGHDEILNTIVEDKGEEWVLGQLDKVKVQLYADSLGGGDDA